MPGNYFIASVMSLSIVELYYKTSRPNWTHVSSSPRDSYRMRGSCVRTSGKCREEIRGIDLWNDKKWERGTKDFLDVFLFRFSRESRRQWYRITESETKVFGRCNMHFFKNKTLSRCLFEIFYVYLIKIISTRVCTFLSLIILLIYI